MSNSTTFHRVKRLKTFISMLVMKLAANKLNSMS